MNVKLLFRIVFLRLLKSLEEKVLFLFLNSGVKYISFLEFLSEKILLVKELLFVFISFVLLNPENILFEPEIGLNLFSKKFLYLFVNKLFLCNAFNEVKYLFLANLFSSALKEKGENFLVKLGLCFFISNPFVVLILTS